MRQKETEMPKHVVPPQKFGACCKKEISLDFFHDFKARGPFNHKSRKSNALVAVCSLDLFILHLHLKLFESMKQKIALQKPCFQ